MGEPRYLGDKPSQPPEPDYLKPESTTSRAQRHERSSAKRSGKRTTSGSGNRQGHRKSRGSGSQMGSPGDLAGDEDLAELKTTQKTDTRIQLRWLRKITNEALCMGKQPMIEFEFERLTPPCPKKWVMIPAEYFDDLQERARS